MITITKDTIEDIPVLEVVPTSLQTKSLPTVIYYHGFYGQKQDSLTIAYNIAEQGIRVILPDAPMHGKRNHGNKKQAIDLAFWEIVMQNVQDIETIYHYLCKHDKYNPTTDKIGVGGTSMGGITTAAALTQYEWINSAAIVMGSPHLTAFAQYLIHIYNQEHNEPIANDVVEATLTKIAPFDLSNMPEKLNGRPLLFWHGADDIVVPTCQSETFYNENKTQSEGHQMKYVKEPGRSHHVSRLAVAETSAWFGQHLKSETV